MKRLIPFAMALAALTRPAGATEAEGFPSRPVRMIIPFPAGGPADFVGRVFAQQLTDTWGRQVVADNRAGASGIIGTELAANATPDGYTLLFGSTSTFSVNTVLFRKLPYDVFRDFELLGLVAKAPHVLAVRETLPAQNAKELIAAARQQPGKYTFASAGTGTIVHMAGELFRSQASIELVHVPFKGGGPATIGLLAGEVDMVVNDLTTLLVHVKSGKLRVLGAAHTQRLQPLPDVPTFAELGMPGIVSSTWWGTAAPAKTPAAILRQLVQTQNAILARPTYAERLASVAVEPVRLTPQETTRFIRQDTEKWRKVAALAKVPVQ